MKALTGKRTGIRYVFQSAKDLLDKVEAFENAAYCIRCGAEQTSPIEPDAIGVKCESCGKKAVYGAEELLLRGLCHE